MENPSEKGDEQSSRDRASPSVRRRSFLAAAGVVAGTSAFGGIATGKGDDSDDGGSDPVAGFFERGVDVGLTKVAGGLTAPTDFAVAADDRERWFVTDQTGQAYYYEDDELHRFVDVEERMVELGNIYGQYPLEKPGMQYDERGLTGIEFHPDFAGNSKVYLHYSAPPDDELPDGWDHYEILSEFEVADDGDSVNLDSERVLLKIAHPQMNHNAGPFAFGPDGYLYFPMGDGGGANDDFYGHVDDWYGMNAGGNAQNVTENFLGTILRIDVDSEEDGKPYGIPDDNPLVGTEGLDEIYSWGHRNVFGVSFDSNGNFFVPNVGATLYEEVNVVLKGGNYGWNLKEGTHCFDAANRDSPPSRCPDFAPATDGEGVEPLIDPIVEFPHEYEGEPVGQAVIGGYVYEGDAIPDLRGKYVYGAFMKAPGGEPDGRLLTAAPPGGEIGEVTIEDLEPDFPEDAEVPSEYVNPTDDNEPGRGDAPSGETGEKFGDALIDRDNKKNEIPRDQLWDMAQLNVVGTEGGTPQWLVRMFGRDEDGELYVLVSKNPIPKGDTGAVLKIVPPDEDGGN